MIVKFEKDGLLTPEFLLEHLEGELGASHRDDIELLLMNSVADRRLLKSLETTKGILKMSLDVSMPEDGRFYERMHASIMSAIVTQGMDAEDSASDQRPSDLYSDLVGDQAASRLRF